MAILNINKLTKSFGGLTAVSNVTMELREGELVGLMALTEPENNSIQSLIRPVCALQWRNPP